MTLLSNLTDNQLNRNERASNRMEDKLYSNSVAQKYLGKFKVDEVDQESPKQNKAHYR